jgi:type III pantothenate kinase
MLLAIDAGNSAIKIGLGDESGALCWSMSAPRPEPSLEVLSGLLGQAKKKAPWGIKLAFVASVVPDLLHPMILALEPIVGRKYAFLNAANVPGLAIEYETKDTLGADRIANALYLSQLERKPAISVDFGTATKIDAVSSEGAYLGGAIMPGLRMMLQSLARGTAQLPELEPELPESVIGRSTKGSILSGTVIAHAKAVEGLLQDFQAELGSRAEIVGTGGLMEFMTELCPSIREKKANMTLEGLLIAGRRWSAMG